MSDLDDKVMQSARHVLSLPGDQTVKDDVRELLELAERQGSMIQALTEEAAQRSPAHQTQLQLAAVVSERDKLRAELDEAWEVTGCSRFSPVVEFGPAGGPMAIQPGSGEPRTLADVLRIVGKEMEREGRRYKEVKAERDRLEAELLEATKEEGGTMSDYTPTKGGQG